MPPLSPGDRSFLQTNLLHLQAPNGLIPASVREACRTSLEAALRGEIPVACAASALVRGHQENLVHNLESLTDPQGRPVRFVGKIERYPLGEMDGRAKTLPPGIRRLLAESPGDSEVVEVIANFDDSDSIPVKKVKNETRISYGPPVITTLYRLIGLKEFYHTVIHPRGSRIWRFLPLPLLTGAIAAAGGDAAVSLQWTAVPSTFEEMRDIVSRNRKPVCVGTRPSLPPDLQDSPATEGLDKPAFCRVHNEIYDAYRMLIHDLCHVIEWNELLPGQREEEVALDDALMRALRGFPAEFGAQPVFEDIRDSIFSYYHGREKAPGMIEASLRHAAHDNQTIDRRFVEAFLQAFRRELA
jgi:hypothetical protein